MHRYRRFTGLFVLIFVLTLALIAFVLIKYSFKTNSRRLFSSDEYLHKHKDVVHSSLRSNAVRIANHAISLYVHFDLKGAAPKISYFEKLFPLLREWGAGGICMEYEDMFPFDGIVGQIKHKQAYTKTEIERINQLAKDNQLDVMPLLQTYGHLEFLLKLNEFSDLRENPKYPQVITPCVNKTYTILFSMIDQYLDLHPNLRLFHLGHDEVYYSLTHPACEQFKRSTGIQSQYDLFAHHLNTIVNYIKRKSPHIVLFVWHDVLQNLNLQVLQKYDFIHSVNPVLWSYREDMQVEGFVTGSQADVFGQYKALWGATAFKGATDEIATVSDVKHYYQNQASWIKQLQTSIPTKWKNFGGIILTGWSRYDHFLSLCELLPYAIPSMLFSLAAWREQFQNLPRSGSVPSQVQEYVQKQLQCSSPLHLTAQDHSSMTPIPKCKFPGAGVYESMISLPRVWQQVEQAESFVNKYVTDLHVKYRYIHVKRAEECLERLSPAIDLLKSFISSFTEAMNEVFPPQVAVEWLETYFTKRYNAVNARYEFIRRAVNEQRAWAPRPIPDLDMLKSNVTIVE